MAKQKLHSFSTAIDIARDTQVIRCDMKAWLYVCQEHRKLTQRATRTSKKEMKRQILEMVAKDLGLKIQIL